MLISFSYPPTNQASISPCLIIILSSPPPQEWPGKFSPFNPCINPQLILSSRTNVWGKCPWDWLNFPPFMSTLLYSLHLIQMIIKQSGLTAVLLLENYLLAPTPVSGSVSESFIVSFWRLLSHLRALRACSNSWCLRNLTAKLDRIASNHLPLMKQFPQSLLLRKGIVGGQTDGPT